MLACLFACYMDGPFSGFVGRGGDGENEYVDWGDGSIYLSVDCFGSLLLEATRRARRMLLCHVLSCFALFDRLGKGRGRERGSWRELSRADGWMDGVCIYRPTYLASYGNVGNQSKSIDRSIEVLILFLSFQFISFHFKSLQFNS